ncbi:MAG TPA: ABC transporter ATP-binding protein [Candidatus Saccharimonadales bacterium]|nr:ABC transporter ATP-binding protein [Candidatus Saccharimonadales bacterium]
MAQKKLVSIIKATDNHKTYGKNSTAYEALRGVNLDIKQGESIAIVGKSGSGKSTLMHLLAGLDSPSSGELLWKGERVNGMSEKQLTDLRNRNIGFVFQQFFLQPTLTVMENTYLPLKIAGISSAKRKVAAEKALKAVGLLDKASNRATDLSGGQKQRVAIARALVGQPNVIFADEPTGNLDTETGQQVIDLLFSLQKERAITLVIVTHDEDLANKCDRTIYITDGKVVKS